MKRLTAAALFTILAFACNSQPAVGLNLGNKAPELALQKLDGTILKLSSLRGKMVLIDFWASWCGPCRHENPSLVSAYKTYKSVKFKGGNGFTIYSVSLDVNPAAWKQAIAVDGLEWENHVSDLGGWQSAAAAQYGIASIPSSLLINGDGIIVAKNLRGPELAETLEKMKSAK